MVIIDLQAGGRSTDGVRGLGEYALCEGCALADVNCGEIAGALRCRLVAEAHLLVLRRVGQLRRRLVQGKRLDLSHLFSALVKGRALEVGLALPAAAETGTMYLGGDLMKRFIKCMTRLSNLGLQSYNRPIRVLIKQSVEFFQEVRLAVSGYDNIAHRRDQWPDVLRRGGAHNSKTARSANSGSHP
jgi:hypothetical protein